MNPALAVLTLLVAPVLVGAAVAPRATAGVRWALGVVMLCLAGILLHGLGVPAVIARWALAALTVVAAVRWATTTSSMRLRRVDPVFGLAFVLIAVVGVLVTLSEPVNAWDAVAIWYAKTRALLDGRPIASMPIPPYPEMGPMGWSLVLAIAGTFAEPVGRLVFLGLYLAWLASLPRWLPRAASLRIRLLAIAAVIAGLDIGRITNGYQDAVVMSVAGLAAVLLGGVLLDAGTEAETLSSDDRLHAALGLVFAGVLGAIKAEGAILGAILVGGWAITVATARGPRFLVPILPFVGLWMALTTVWPLLLAANGVDFGTFQPGAYRTISPFEMFGRLSRLPFIAYGFARMGPWYVVPVVAAALASVAAWRQAPAVRPVVAWLWGSAVAHGLWIVAVILITNWDFHWEIRTALDRLEIQHAFVWPLTTIVSVVALDTTAARAERAR